MPQAPPPCIKSKPGGGANINYVTEILKNYICYCIYSENVHYSERTTDCQRQDFFSNKPTELINPNLFKCLNGIEKVKKRKKRSLEDFDPVLLMLCSLR